MLKINKKTIPIITVLFCIFMMICLCGAAGADEICEEPIDGGSTNLTDYSAPKEFSSAEITGFDASFCLFTRWKTDENDNFFHFRVEKDEHDVLMASEEILGISHPADDALLGSLQEVVEQNDLAEMNGVYDVTAGLSPEYSAGGLTVEYVSGETLKFTTDNNPYALWAEEVYDVFAEWFDENRDSSLYPPEDDSQVTYVRIWLIEGDTEEYVEFPDDLYEKITGIISEYELVRKYNFSYYDHDSGLYDMHDLGYYGFGNKTPGPEEDSEDMMLSITVYFESGEQIHIDTAKESEITAMKPLIDELIGCYDPVS